MTITGNIFRSLVKNNAFSALFDLSFSNVTGVAEIGFSGQNKKYNFSFISGKIFDNENRYFSSYSPLSQVLLSTNFSGKSYDYAINSNIVTYSGSKQDFYAENFYANTTGVDVGASIIIRAKKPTLTLSLPSSFITGQTITGYLQTNSASGIKVFTGDFGELSSFSFLSFPAGDITSVASGQVLISQKNIEIGNFTTDINLETNAGNYSQNVSISSVEKPFLDYVLTSNIDENSFAYLAQNGETTGVAKENIATVNYNYYTNYPNLEQSSLPLSISLSYVSGITGYYGLVADVTLSSGGNGYLAAPTVIFSGGLTGQLAQGELLSVVGDYFIKSSFTRFEFPSGEPIRFWKKGSNILPSPLQENFTYYVTSVFSGGFGQPQGGFQISTTLGGSALDVTSTGSGNFYYYSLNQLPSAQAVLGQTRSLYDQVVDVNILNYGSGYTSSPTVIFSGGTGIINNATPTIASGSAAMVYYTKSFTGCFNLYTGLAGNYINYKANNYILNNNYSGSASYTQYNNPINIKVSYTPFLDSNQLVAKLLISGANNLKIEQYITGVK
jgi:hypothetical protein